MTKLIHPIKVDEDVWLELIRRKYAGRYRNINEPLREALGLPMHGYPAVKNYSDESAGDDRECVSLVPVKAGLTFGNDRG